MSSLQHDQFSGNYTLIVNTGCPITTARTTEATVPSTTTAIAPPTLHTSPTPTQPPGTTTDGNSDPTTAADDIGLYVGIAVPVGLVMIAVTVIMILLLFVIHKRRAKKHKQSGKIQCTVLQEYFAGHCGAEKLNFCDITIAFWQGSCVFTSFYCCALINQLLDTRKTF